MSPPLGAYTDVGDLLLKVNVSWNNSKRFSTQCVLEFFTNCKLLTAGSPITYYYIMADMISCSLVTMASMPLLLYYYLPNAIK